MEKLKNDKPKVKRIGGYLHKVVPLLDSSGKIVERIITPLMVEVRRRDIMQIIVGSSILAIPLAYTEESWNLGSELPISKIVLIGILSVLFVSFFVYYNFYRNLLKGYVSQFVKRILLTYLLSLLMVGILLTLIEKCPWGIDNMLAIKRIILVGLPASMSATVTDSLK
jgi:uncharacterized membrane protein